jgi:dethiobiotin synthetase
VLRGLFVTGTDTGVGKTVVAAALLHRYRAEVRLRYWKPIQTGIEQDDDTAEVGRLGRCEPTDVLSSGVRLPRPVSPHLAARLSACTICLQPLVDSLFAEASSSCWIVEGAGGTLVPVNDSETIADLMVRLGLPVVVVAKTTLGTINHTLLTLEALRRRALCVAGVVMVGDRNAENRSAIERYGDVVVLGEMPYFDPLTAGQLAQWADAELDPERQLLELLR